jgi:hypothetical protein
VASQATAITSTLRELFYNRVWSSVPGAPQIWQDNVSRPDFPPSQTWCRFVVAHGTAEQASIATEGSRRFRTEGSALVQLFTPHGDGDQAALEILRMSQDAFRTFHYADPAGAFFLRFGSPYIATQPVIEDGWWLTVITLPYAAEDFA